jgi:hypothetical protein
MAEVWSNGRGSGLQPHGVQLRRYEELHYTVLHLRPGINAHPATVHVNTLMMGVGSGALLQPDDHWDGHHCPAAEFAH